MSAIVFSGAAQFATLAVLGAGGSAVAAIVAATLVASRFLAIGVAIGPSMRGGTVRRGPRGPAGGGAPPPPPHKGGGRPRGGGPGRPPPPPPPRGGPRAPPRAPPPPPAPPPPGR